MYFFDQTGNLIPSLQAGVDMRSEALKLLDMVKALPNVCVREQRHCECFLHQTAIWLVYHSGHSPSIEVDRL